MAYFRRWPFYIKKDVNPFPDHRVCVCVCVCVCVWTFYKVYNKIINHVTTWSVFVENKAQVAPGLQLVLAFDGGEGFKVSAHIFLASVIIFMSLETINGQFFWKVLRSAHGLIQVCIFFDWLRKDVSILYLVMTEHLR